MTIHTMQRRIGSTLTAAALAFGLAVPVWAEETLEQNAQAALATFKKTDPAMSTRMADSVGYVIFPTVGKGAVGIGAAAGTGVLYENGKPVGKVTLSQVTVGLQLGGQAYSEIIFFENAHTLADFKRGNFSFAAQVSAVAAAAGASANAKYEQGVQVYTIAKGGLMYEASVGGQKFQYTPYGKEKVM